MTFRFFDRHGSPARRILTILVGIPALLLIAAGAYLAVSCMTSAMTRNQVVAFILAVVVCLFLVLAGFNPVTDLLTRWASPTVVDTVAAFSVVTHFDAFQRGVIDARDLLFFLSVIGFALFATGVIIRGHRAG
jgi:ABC-2 type transport system permease protein